MNRAMMFIAAALVVPAGGPAQTMLPTGTVLPLSLSTSVSARRARPGQKVVARLEQQVPLPSDSIPSGTKVLGRVTKVSAGNHAPAFLALRFDRLLTAHGEVVVQTSLRAIASYMSVSDAQVPINGPDRGAASPWDWTTRQIGGDIVYRGGGPVVGSGGTVVGRPVWDGVLDRVTTRPGSRCRGPLPPQRAKVGLAGDPGDASQPPQALWLFSSEACGVYGMPGLNIQHAGRTAPQGEIVLTSAKNDLKLPRGTGLLLRIIPATPADVLESNSNGGK
jgi:hypothetical protein